MCLEKKKEAGLPPVGRQNVHGCFLVPFAKLRAEQSCEPHPNPKNLTLALTLKTSSSHVKSGQGSVENRPNVALFRGAAMAETKGLGGTVRITTVKPSTA